MKKNQQEQSIEPPKHTHRHTHTHTYTDTHTRYTYTYTYAHTHIHIPGRHRHHKLVQTRQSNPWSTSGAVVFHYLPEHINKASDQIANQSSSNCAAAAAAPANHHIGTVGSRSQLNACELTKLLMTLKSSRWGGTGYAGVDPSLTTCWFEHSFEILLFYWPEHQEIVPVMNARFAKVLSVP